MYYVQFQRILYFTKEKNTSSHLPAKTGTQKGIGRSKPHSLQNRRNLGLQFQVGNGTREVLLDHFIEIRVFLGAAGHNTGDTLRGRLSSSEDVEAGGCTAGWRGGEGRGRGGEEGDGC